MSNKVDIVPTSMIMHYFDQYEQWQWVKLEDYYASEEKNLKIIKNLVEKTINPPVIYQTDDKEFAIRTEKTMSGLHSEIDYLTEEIVRLEQIVLERGLS